MIFVMRLDGVSPSMLDKQAHFVNVIKAASDLTVKVIYVGGSDETFNLRQGMALKLNDVATRFYVSGDLAQTAQLWLSDTQLDYRMSEVVQSGSSGLLSVEATTYTGEVSELLKAEPGRGKVVVYPQDEIVVGGANLNYSNGILIKAGEKLEIATQAPIYAYTNKGGYGAKLGMKFGADSTLLEGVAPSGGGRIGLLAYDKTRDKLIYSQNGNIYSNLSEGYDSANEASMSSWGEWMGSPAEIYKQVGDKLYFLASHGTQLKAQAVELASGTVTAIESSLTSTSWGVANIGYSENAEKVLVCRYAVGSVSTENVKFELFSAGAALDVTGALTLKAADVQGVIVDDNGTLFVFSNMNVLVSQDDGLNWVSKPLPIQIKVAGKPGVRNYKGGVYYYDDNNTVRASFDGGDSWGTVFGRSTLQDFHVDENRVLALSSVGLEYSEDDGKTFTTLVHQSDLNGTTYPTVMTLCANNTLYTATQKGVINRVAGETIKTGGLTVSLLTEVNQ